VTAAGILPVRPLPAVSPAALQAAVRVVAAREARPAGREVQEDRVAAEADAVEPLAVAAFSRIA
jgi:hypothetical protein